MKFIQMIVLTLCLSASLQVSSKTLMFVSFSMPEKLLLQTIKDAANHNAPVVFNGLINGSMRDTLSAIFNISKKVNNAAVQIDPIAFDKYGIKNVPALVVDNEKEFDVVYGNIAVNAALELVKRKGVTGRVE